MIDSADYRIVKETEALAKRLGFKLEHRMGAIVLVTTKDWPSATYGKNVEVIAPHTIEEVRSWLRGWANAVEAFEYVGLTVEDYNKMLEDKKILDALKGKRTNAK
jgi:hypothetical protein